MKYTIQKERNERARSEIVRVVNDNGLKWKFISEKLSMKLPNVSNWRKGLYQFGEDKLNQIETLIEKYD